MPIRYYQAPYDTNETSDVVVGCITPDDGTYAMLARIVNRVAHLERKMAAIEGKLAKMGENQRERYTESLELG